MEASASTTTTTISIKRTAPQGRQRTYAAFRVSRVNGEAPPLPRSALELARTHVPVPPMLCGSNDRYVTVDPRQLPESPIVVHKGQPARTFNFETTPAHLDWFAGGLTRSWGPNVHAKVASRVEYTREQAPAYLRNGTPFPCDYHTLKSISETELVVLVALPDPHTHYTGSVAFDAPPGISIELDALHHDPESFMRAWHAIGNNYEELVVVDPHLLQLPVPRAPAFEPCDDCASSVRGWTEATLFAERAVSLCGKCYVEYKRRENAGENADPPPQQRVSPFVFARDRHDVPLNAEKAKMTTTHDGFIFH